MTIPSITMTESRTADTGTSSAAGDDLGPELNVGSFASFLGDESGDTTAGRTPIPATKLTVNVVPMRVRVTEGPEESSISENSNVRPTVRDQSGLPKQQGAVGLERAEDGARNSTVAGIKNGALGRGKAEGAAGSKRMPGPPVGQGSLDSASAMVVTPVADDAAMATPVPAQSEAIPQGVVAFDVPVRDQIFSQEVTAGVDEATAVKKSSVEVAVGVDEGPIAYKQVAAAMVQVPQLAETASSSTAGAQTSEAQPDAWNDMAQASLLWAAPSDFLQNNTHVLSMAADKTSKPADSIATTLDSPLVAEPAQGDANQLPYDALNRSAGEPLFAHSDWEVVARGSSDAGSVSGVGSKKSDVRENRVASSVSSVAQQNDAATISATSTFGTTLSKQFRASAREGDLRQSLSGAPALSASEQFAIERHQTLGAARALGDALQSTAGLGVQTESFGRVTIHTATEGNHLLAQVTLEDGRQSAALVSHVPAVEQRLAQQLGLQAAVNVSTGAHTASGGLSSDGEDPQQRRGTAGAKTEKGREESVPIHSIDDLRTPSSSELGRIDVTV